MTDCPKDPSGLLPGIPAGPRTGRPWQTVTAVGLLLTSALLWLPVAGGDPVISQPASLLLLLHIVFAVRARRGRQKARITVAVVTLLLLFLLMPHAWLGFTDPGHPSGPAYAVMDMIAVAASCTGVALLFTSSSNAYFRARGEALPRA